MKKTLLFSLVAGTAITASAATLGTEVTVDNLSTQIADNVVISFHSMDGNGGAHYYFNGNAVKTAPDNFSYNNLYQLVQKEGTEAYYLLRLCDKKYVGKNGDNIVMTDTPDNAQTDAFTITMATSANANFNNSAPIEGATLGTNTIRFNSTLQNGMFLNVNNSNLSPIYKSGTGGFSFWGVTTYTEEEVQTVPRIIDGITLTISDGTNEGTATLNGVKAGTKFSDLAAAQFDFFVPEESDATVSADNTTATVNGRWEFPFTPGHVYKLLLRDGMSSYNMSNLGYIEDSNKVYTRNTDSTPNEYSFDKNHLWHLAYVGIGAHGAKVTLHTLANENYGFACGSGNNSKGSLSEEPTVFEVRSSTQANTLNKDGFALRHIGNNFAYVNDISGELGIWNPGNESPHNDLGSFFQAFAPTEDEINGVSEATATDDEKAAALDTPSVSNIMALFTEPTGISRITVGGSDTTAAYDLQGRRVARPSKGLYIIGGHKVIVK